MKKVFLAMPVYTGQFEWQCTSALINNVRNLEKAGWQVEVYFHPGCLYIDQVRCLCAQKFLESGCDEMVFIDSDLWFEDGAIAKLLSYDKEIIFGAYPFKNNSGYPIAVHGDPDVKTHHTPFVEIQPDGMPLIKCQVAPTGLMKIRRTVYEKMMEAHPEWKIKNAANGEYFLFFDCGKHRDDSDQWYGEDVLFCLRWQDLGGEIWCVPNINFKHIGKIEAHGNYHEFLMRMPRV